MTIDDVALTLVAGVGCKTIVALMDAFASAQAVFAASGEELIEKGFSERLVHNLARRDTFEQADDIIKKCQHFGVKIAVRGEEFYPHLLAQCEDAPHILYIYGKLDFNALRSISIVGTRRASESGLLLTQELVSDLARGYNDIAITSGLAFGVDKAAHAAAVEHNVPTVGVLAGWVLDIVPRQHVSLARDIIRGGGALVSEYPPNTTILPNSFLRRNRIIAGLSWATVVIESALKGGSLVTADIAASYNRAVFAIPGRASDANFAGTNMLIKCNKAYLYQDVTDIAAELGWPRRNAIQISDNMVDGLPDYLAKVFVVIPQSEPVVLDQVVELTGMSLADASSSLIHLEAKGLIKSMPGGLYIKARF